MPKRRLTRQQKNRIRQRQKQQITERDAGDATIADETSGPRLTGVVTCNFGQQLEVEVRNGALAGQLFRCYQRSNLPPLVCGDHVVFETGENGAGVIVAMEDRHSVFSRPGPGGELRPVAANIDLVLVVLAARPQPFLNLLDRYLVAIENLHLAPLIVINKADLPETATDPAIAAVQTLYPKLGYAVVTVSALAGDGIDALKISLKGKTAVIVGQSGVGKSSLINALDPELKTLVGEMSGDEEKGTHTTTAARLFHLHGFDLIDSPGIREFHLWQLEPGDLLEGFIEFRPYLGHCRFRDCSHRNEPGCALQAAVIAGAIPGERLERYFQILDSLAES